MNRTRAKQLRKDTLVAYMAIPPKERKTVSFSFLYRKVKRRHVALRNLSRSPKVVRARIGKHEQVKSVRAGIDRRARERDHKREMRRKAA